MIIDKENKLADAQALTATAASENYIDASVARDIGKGEPLALVVSVTTELDSAGDTATLDIKVEADSVTNFASPTTLVQSAQIAEASCVAGAQFVLPIPPEMIGASDRYLRAYFTVGTENFTSGNIDAVIMPLSMVQTNKHG